MYFKKSNKNYEENLAIKEALESLTPARVGGLALLYIDEQVFTKNPQIPNKDTKCKLCVFMVYESIKTTALSDNFYNIDDFKWQVSRCVNMDGGWQTIDCALDWIGLYTGRMDFQRREEVLNIVKIVLEEYYEIEVGNIVKFLYR